MHEKLTKVSKNYRKKCFKKVKTTKNAKYIFKFLIL